jgi:hypothetical protein
VQNSLPLPSPRTSWSSRGKRARRQVGGARPLPRFSDMARTRQWLFGLNFRLARRWVKREEKGAVFLARVLFSLLFRVRALPTPGLRKLHMAHSTASCEWSESSTGARIMRLTQTSGVRASPPAVVIVALVVRSLARVSDTSATFSATSSLLPPLSFSLLATISL